MKLLIITNLLFMLVIALRFVWHRWVSLWACGAFWIVIVVWQACTIVAYHPHIIPKLLTSIGMIMNCLVTVANGGVMPVIGADEDHSIWMVAKPWHRFLSCADHASWWGFSVGDFVLFLGIALSGVKSIP